MVLVKSKILFFGGKKIRRNGTGRQSGKWALSTKDVLVIRGA